MQELIDKMLETAAHETIIANSWLQSPTVENRGNLAKRHLERASALVEAAELLRTPVAVST